MPEFNVGDKVRRIINPGKLMPLNSEWVIESINEYGNLKMINDSYEGGGWFQESYELVERASMKYYAVIEIDSNTTSAPTSDDIAHALADAGIQGRVSSLTPQLPMGVRWCKKIEPNLLPLIVKDI